MATLDRKTMMLLDRMQVGTEDAGTALPMAPPQASAAAAASQNPSAGQQLLDEAGTAELSTDKKSVGKQLSGAVRGLAQNYVALCAVVGLIVFLLMCLMRPPMELKPASSLLTRPTLSLAKAALWGLGTASVMIAAPVVYKLYKKKAADD